MAAGTGFRHHSAGKPHHVEPRGGLTARAYASMTCNDAVRVEGRIQHFADGAKVGCTPFRHANPGASGYSMVMFKSAQTDGINASCAMTAFH